MKILRVLIVDDSAAARELLQALLTAVPDIRVVGTAADGREAVARALDLQPDLVTMDLEMPVLDGLGAIEEIMSRQAVPILVVSSQASARTAYEAVARGALEVIPKPAVDQGPELVRRVRLLAGVPVIKHIRFHKPAPAAAPAPAPAPAFPGLHFAVPAVGERGRVFAIASSTGGPQVLAALLAALPAAFPCPVLISQHIADGFAGGMARWLDGVGPLPVHLAAEGEPVCPGQVYVSPSERHMTVTDRHTIRLVPTAPADIYHPNCDALLTSVAKHYGDRAVGLILTGMGRDGVAGMAALHRAGATTLAQDEASSVIFGMNRLAIEAGAVARVLALEALAEELIWLAGQPLPAVGALR
jgi:two-component system chemotaxis response regulator CheB